MNVITDYMNTMKKICSSYENFKKNIGTKESIDIFPTLADNGDLIEINGIETIIKSILNILLTQKYTYPFDPEFGADVPKYVFEMFDEITKNSLSIEITESVRKYEDRARISFDFKELMETDKKGIWVLINIEYGGTKKYIKVPIDETCLKNIDNDDYGL